MQSVHVARDSAPANARAIGELTSVRPFGGTVETVMQLRTCFGYVRRCVRGTPHCLRGGGARLRAQFRQRHQRLWCLIPCKLGWDFALCQTPSPDDARYDPAIATQTEVLQARSNAARRRWLSQIAILRCGTASARSHTKHA